MERIGFRRSAAKINRLDFILLFCFFVSAIHQFIALSFGFVALLYFSQRKDAEGLLKAFYIFSLRASSMSVLIFDPISSAGLKYGLLLGYAITLILISEVSESNLGKLIRIKRLLLVYCAYISVDAFIVSSYPVVSLIKLFLFAIAFYSVLKTIASTYYCDWIGFFSRWFYVITFLCLATIPFSVFRTRNGFAFQGIFDHPNIYGIFGAIVVSFVLLKSDGNKRLKLFMVISTLYMQYLSRSRTGLFSSIIVLLLYVIFTNRKRLGRMFFILIASVVVAGIALILIPSFSDAITRFFWKSATGDLFYSRSGQIYRYSLKREANPLLGTGFMTPFIPGFHSYAIDLNLYVEDGNIFFAVLGQTGTIGLLFWLLLYVGIFFNGNKDLAHMFIAPFVVSSGEMVFFSTNSVGVFFYVMFGIFLFTGINSKSNNRFIAESYNGKFPRKTLEKKYMYRSS